MMSSTTKIVVCFFLAIVMSGTAGVSESHADVLLPGYKSVKHELVFEDSDLFKQHRLVAAPIRGFGGVAEIKPGERFLFSQKYGTRFYLVPDSVTELPPFHEEVYGQWPNCLPPREEIHSLPVTSPTASALTTLRFASVGESGPVIEEVEHVELNRFGNVASPTKSILIFGLAIAAGLAFCLIAIRRMKKARRLSEAAAIDAVAGEKQNATSDNQVSAST